MLLTQATRIKPRQVFCQICICAFVTCYINIQSLRDQINTVDYTSVIWKGNDGILTAFYNLTDTHIYKSYLFIDQVDINSGARSR